MGNNKYKILIVDDDADALGFMKTLISTNGYHAITARTCSEADLMLSSHRPDMVLLDICLPDLDGLDYIRIIRSSSAVPVMVVSARSEEDIKIAALDLGANDYVTKPFGTGELLARVRVCLRNSRHSSEMGTVPGGTFSVGSLSILYDRRTVTVGGADIRLTQTEYNIIALLSEHAGRVVAYEDIIREIWGDSDLGSIKRLQVNMANIRKKLAVDPDVSKFILNEPGAGYRLAPEDRPSK